MKKFTALTLSIILGSTVAAFAADIKVGGSVDMTYSAITTSSPDSKQSGFSTGLDHNATELSGTMGADGYVENTGAFITVDASANDKVSAHIMLLLPTGADAYAREAYITVNYGAAGKIDFGKKTMPFGQNKWAMVTPGYVDLGDISELSGITYSNNIGNMLAVDIATFENDVAPGTDDEADTGLFQSYALRLTGGPEKMQFQVSLAKQHNELATAAQKEDIDSMSVGGDLDLGKVGVYFEYLTAKHTLGGAATGDVTGNAIQLGVSFAVTDANTVGLELNTMDGDTDMDNDSNTKIGLKFSNTRDDVTLYAGFEQETRQQGQVAGTDNDDKKSTVLALGATVNF